MAARGGKGQLHPAVAPPPVEPAMQVGLLPEPAASGGPRTPESHGEERWPKRGSRASSRVELGRSMTDPGRRVRPTG